jgi:hypothetical protein
MYQVETGLAIGALDGAEPSRNINLGPMEGARVVRWAPRSEGFDFVNDQNGANNLLRLPPDGVSPIALAHVDSGIIWNFAWSPDGTKLALANGDVSSDVVLIRRVNTK